jgi:hypothetical protein
MSICKFIARISWKINGVYIHSYSLLCIASKGKAVPVLNNYATKTYGGVDVATFQTSALVGSEWSSSHPCCFIPGERSSGGWVGPRAGLDVEKRKFFTLPGLELRPLGDPAHGQSLY